MCKSPKFLYTCMEKLSMTIYASILLRSRHLDDLETLISDTSLHNNKNSEHTIIHMRLYYISCLIKININYEVLILMRSPVTTYRFTIHSLDPKIEIIYNNLGLCMSWTAAPTCTILLSSESWESHSKSDNYFMTHKPQIFRHAQSNTRISTTNNLPLLYYQYNLDLSNEPLINIVAFIVIMQ